MVPIQDSDIGRILRRMSRPEGTNIVALRTDPECRPLSPEEALIQWMLDLPQGAAIDKAARYVLRVVHADHRTSPDIRRFCDYLRQVIVASEMPLAPGRGGRKRRN